MNYATLDLNLLRVFAAVFRRRNVTLAGSDLGLSQPAVSAALARLRDHLGDALFLRVGNRMVPTPQAESIAPIVAEALDRLAAALIEVAPFDPSTSEARFTLRGADFFSMRLVPTLAASLSRKAPGVTLRFLDSSHGDLLGLLAEGKVDLALEQPMDPPPWVARADLFLSPFVVVASRGNKALRDAADGATMPLNLFCGLPHVLRSVDGSMTGMTDTALAAVGLRRRVVLTLPQFEAVLRAVAQSDMISVVPVQLARELADGLGLVIFQPPIAIPAPTMSLYWHRRHDQLPAQAWLRAEVQTLCARMWGAQG